MNKRITLAIFTATVLFALSIGIVLAQENNPDEIQATWQPARFPWVTQYVQRVIEPNALDLGSYNSIAYNPVDGMPYISYYDATNGDLMLASPAPDGGSNCGPSGDWWCRPVDGDGLEGRSTDNVGQYSSLAFWKSSDLPLRSKLGISYYDATQYSLRYAVWSCIMYTCEWEISDIATGSQTFSVGLYTSLHYDSQGNPHIAYYGNSLLGADNLFYTTYIGGVTGNCGPSNNWDCDIVDSGTGVGIHASLDLRYDDTALIAYYREDLGDLKYAYFSGIGNCGSGNTWYCQTIEEGASDVGLSASFTAPQYNGDIIRVAYYDKTNHKLRYAYSGLASGEGNCGPSDSWQCNDVDDMSAITPVGISMKLDPQGYPIIAYQYVEPDQPQAHALLRIARPYLAYDDGSFGNCGDVPPGYLFLYWRCLTLDAAGPETYAAAFVSLAIADNGLAVISYSERDDYYSITSLKLAYQRIFLYLPLVKR